MSVEIAWKQNILVPDFHLLKSLLVVLGFGSQAFVCGFGRQNINSAYKLMCFDRNINGNRDVKFFECDYLLVQRCVNIFLSAYCPYTHIYCSTNRGNHVSKQHSAAFILLLFFRFLDLDSFRESFIFFQT